MTNLEKLKTDIKKQSENFTTVILSSYNALHIISVIELYEKALGDLSSTEWSWDVKPTEKEPMGKLKNTFVIKAHASEALTEGRRLIGEI